MRNINSKRLINNKSVEKAQNLITAGMMVLNNENSKKTKVENELNLKNRYLSRARGNSKHFTNEPLKFGSFFNNNKNVDY